MNYNNGTCKPSSLIWLILSVLVLSLFRPTIADNKAVPTANVNLSPFQQWRSAHYCILFYKPPNPCPAKHNLTEAGVINVDPTDAAEYCQQNGCGDYTKSVVLNCIHHVKKNYIFANKATVKQINDTINQVCSSHVASPPNSSG